MLYGINSPLRTALFISGTGSTLQSLLEMQHQFNIQLIVSNKKKALGLLKAKRFGKPVFVIEQEIDYSALQQELLKNKIEKIILVGFMKIIPDWFVGVWKDRMINIHPSLLPEYPGLRSAERNWQEQKDMGASLHVVTPELDQGRTLLQQKSLSNVGRYPYNEAEIFLRRTEQHLLRELCMRWN
jgi:phosphoribosylglycinamide formyltransferase 1